MTTPTSATTLIPYGKSFTADSVLSAPSPLPPGVHQKNPYVPYIKPSFTPFSPMLPQAGFPSHLLLTSPPWRGCIDLPVELSQVVYRPLSSLYFI